MTTRTHLSIGEVLSLLSDDFPDLTITKIRFLESQGLIDPERTASGYRKFYDFDIERLRWILRQQRENFLPLKVIRDRLDEYDGKPGTTGADVADQPQLDLARDPGADDPPPVWMADHARAENDRRGTAGETTTTDGAPGPVATTAEVPTPEPDEPNPTGTRSGRRVPPSPGKPGSKSGAKAKAGAKAKKSRSKKPETTGAADRTRPKPGNEKTEQAVTAADEHPTPTAASGAAPTDVSDVSMSRDELIAAAGLDARHLTELESYGIVRADHGPDGDLYGAEAFVCARHAATMLQAGLEPRHLRTYKIAADREAGLYEQLVLPVLRRRTPDARREALEIVDRLVASGAAIHAALLRRSLEEPFGPRR